MLIHRRQGLSRDFVAKHDPIAERRIAEVLQEHPDFRPGIVVEPEEIPDRYAQLLAARNLSGCDRPDEVVVVPRVSGLAESTCLVLKYRQSGELRSERRAVKLNVSLRSNVISAIFAGVIYLIIYLATGGGVAGAIIGAVVLAVIVFLIAFAFSRLVAPRVR